MFCYVVYDGFIIVLIVNVMKNDVDIYLEVGCDEVLVKLIDKYVFEKVLVSYLNIEKDS